MDEKDKYVQDLVLNFNCTTDYTENNQSRIALCLIKCLQWNITHPNKTHTAYKSITDFLWRFKFKSDYYIYVLQKIQNFVLITGI